jgi:hypothetical protein
LLTVGLASAGFFGDLFGTTKKAALVRAPRIVLNGVKTVDVGKFEGAGGEVFAGVLVTSITNAGRMGNAPKEAGLEDLADNIASGLVDDLTGGIAGQVGGAVAGMLPKDVESYEKGLKPDVFKVTRNTAGADVVITGKMETTGPTDANYEAKQYFVDGRGNKQERTVTCTKRQAKMTARFQITRTSDNSILYSGEESAGVSANHCPDDGKALPSGDAMFQHLAQGLAPQAASHFTPFFALMKIELESDKNVKPGNTAALKEDDWDKAMALWQRVLSADEYNYPAVYNMAFANELFGNYDEALKLYEKAEMIGSHKRNQKAMQRVKYRKQEVAQFEAAFGLKVEPHTFAEVSASFVKTVLKGDNSDRYELYEQPDEKSTVITKVPGGLSIQVLDAQGDYVKIKTVDGKEGWVLKKLIKNK